MPRGVRIGHYHVEMDGVLVSMHSNTKAAWREVNRLWRASPRSYYRLVYCREVH